MPLKHKKRVSKSRQPTSIDEDTFQILLNPQKNTGKKRKRDQELELFTEKSDWDPKAVTRYSVRASESHPGSWGELKPYSKFQVRRSWEPSNPLTLSVGSIVYIESDPSKITRDRSGETHESLDDSNFWIAKVKECRAINTSNVFLRIEWLYRPEDLPTGRQPYHGTSEVIPSNHMQIIDALTVDGKVEALQHFDENDDMGVTKQPEDLFWRQTFDCTTGKLSSLRRYCRCKGYANPDTALIQCTNVVCKQWMHQTCISQDTVIRNYVERSLRCEKKGSSAEKNTPEAETSPKDDADTVAAAPESIVGKLTSVKRSLLAGFRRAPSEPAQTAPKQEDNKAMPAKRRGRPPKAKLSVPVASTTADPEGEMVKTGPTFEEASVYFSARVVIDNDKSIESGAEPEAKVVTEKAIWTEVTDLRDGEGQATWHEDIRCFFCNEKVS